MASITLICFLLTRRQVPIRPCKFNLISDSWRAVFLVLFPHIPLTWLFTVFCCNVFPDEGKLNLSY